MSPLIRILYEEGRVMPAILHAYSYGRPVLDQAPLISIRISTCLSSRTLQHAYESVSQNLDGPRPLQVLLQSSFVVYQEHSTVEPHDKLTND